MGGEGLRAEEEVSFEWRLSAACRFMPADMFFPVGTSGMALEEVEAAKAVCRGCPVALDCLRFALETKQEFGVWGGLDEEERRERTRRSREVRLAR